MFNFSYVELWLLIGVIFILIEFNVPGIGFLFLGLGSITSAIVIYNYPLLIEYQITLVGILSLSWFLILWWPLKIFIYGRNNNKKTQGYFDIVGSEVKVVGKAITPGRKGQVMWSGAIMNARLSSDEKEPAEIGDKLYVIQVKGNVLLCAKQK